MTVSPTAADEFKGEAQPSLASQMSRASLQVDGLELQVEGEYADVVYNHEYAKRPFSEQVAQVLKRQWTVQARNTGYLGPRIGQVCYTCGGVLGGHWVGCDAHSGLVCHRRLSSWACCSEFCSSTSVSTTSR